MRYRIRVRSRSRVKVKIKVRVKVNISLVSKMYNRCYKRNILQLCWVRIRASFRFYC